MGAFAFREAEQSEAKRALFACDYCILNK